MANILPIEYLTWAAGTLMLLAIALRMLVLRLYREFPVFFAYTVFHIVFSVALYVIYRDSRLAYAGIYWIGMTVDGLLSLAVIQEIFSKLFQPYPGLRRLGSLLFRWATLLLVAISIITAITSPGSDADRFNAALVVLHRSLAIVEAGLFFFLFMFCRFFSLNWRDYAFGIAGGFGLFAAVFLGASALRVYFGSMAAVTYSLVQTAAYDCATTIWLCYLLAPRRSTEALSSVPDSDAARWNQALLELIRR